MPPPGPYRHFGGREPLGKVRVNPRRLWKTFGPVLRPQLPALGIGTACVFVGMALQKSQPLLTKALVDRGLTPLLSNPWTPEQYERSSGFVLAIIAAMVGIGVVGALISSLRTRVMQRAGARVVRELRSRLYAHLQRLSLRFYESRRTGDVMSRVTGDVSAAESLVTHVGDHFLMEVVSLVVTVVIIFMLNARLAWVAMAPVPVLICLMVWFSRRARPLYREIRDRMGNLSSRLQDNISGIRVIKAFNTEAAEMQRFEAENGAFYDKQIEGVRLMSVGFPLLGFIQAIGVVAVAGTGGWMLIQQNPSLTLGDLFAFNVYVVQLYQPLGHLFMMFNTVLQAMAGGERIAEILETAPDMPDTPGSIDLGPVRGEIRFEDVAFSYADNQPVLHGVNIHAQPGQTVALVGRSGSGKTSLVNLIPRFYDATAGRIMVDGHDVRTVTLNALRRQVAVVLQDPFLFHGTIAENIRYARPEATDAQVEAAATAAHAHAFIAAFPDQYQTVLGERGMTLSGGQKQRLSIARAILADRPILILDEATSMIDTESEVLIQAALERLRAGRTTFVIAHRLSTVQRADQILVLDQGCITERGSHAELMRQNGAYAAMYRMQFRFDEEETAPTQGRQPSAAVALPDIGSAIG